jgi:hypothetical protein
MRLLAVLAHGQQISPPSIEWQRVFGNTEEDVFSALAQTADGGFILGGTSYPPANGNKTCQGFGFVDYWIVRLDAQGNQLWDRCFGGTSRDSLTSLQQTAQGGFILGGSSWSTNSGNKTMPHFGAADDFWAVRLDSEGNKIWEQACGGTAPDLLRRIQETADGGFFLCGGSGSPVSGNKTAPAYWTGLWPSSDYWVVRLDSRGQILWDKSYGGNDDEAAWCAQITADGGLMLGGASRSGPSANKTSSNFGDYDFWVVLTDANGNKVWDRSYGGIYDDTMYAVAQMPDGGLTLAGRSLSPPGGNKTSPNYGNADFWIVRTDANGNKLWDQSFGGPADDFPAAIAVTTDGGVIIGGRSFSGIAGTKTSTNHGACDFWVIRLDADGRKLWEQTYGGSRTDGIESLQQTRDGGFILGGWSHSPADGNKTEPAFFSQWKDFWVVKLGPEQPYLWFSDPPFGPGGLRLALTGIKNLSYAIDWSSNLTNWTALQTNRLSVTNVIEVVDSSTTHSIQRFYRARQVQ